MRFGGRSIPKICFKDMPEDNEELANASIESPMRQLVTGRVRFVEPEAASAA